MLLHIIISYITRVVQIQEANASNGKRISTNHTPTNSVAELDKVSYSSNFMLLWLSMSAFEELGEYSRFFLWVTSRCIEERREDVDERLPLAPGLRRHHRLIHR